MYDPSQQQSDQWRKDPDNWVWGLFYYNKNDPRLFPPKRLEWMGFTINFANPYSIFVAMMAFVLLAFAICKF